MAKEEMVCIGGLWSKKDKNGREFFTGGFGQGRILVMENSYKEKQSDPDFKMYIAKKQEQDKQRQYDRRPQRSPDPREVRQAREQEAPKFDDDVAY